ncbi:MAG: glycosyltransferase [Patescibacteria group bacterium]|nr:glycosyltransferase [Patescibacteria group bacterium]
MKIAILHDWLNHKRGGAENVLFELAEMYPKADIFTLVYNPPKFDDKLGHRIIKTSGLQYFPAFIKKRPKLLLPFIRRAVGGLKLEGYDLVISSSTAWVKNANIKKGTRHVCYCYSPARMLWDSWPKYMLEMNLNTISRFYIVNLASSLRLWDYYQSQKAVEFIAISGFISDRIKKFYGQPSKVIYPPVDISKMAAVNTRNRQEYYLVLSVMSKYKNIELAIEAFIANGLKLVVAGDGPDLVRLKKLASSHPNISFEGRVSADQKSQLMREAKGFIFCNIEDFGITMVESIASGTAVLALRGGGATEIISDGVTGMFFDKPTEGSLNRAIVRFNKAFSGDYKLNNKYLASKFGRDRFVSQLRGFIDGE